MVRSADARRPSCGFAARTGKLSGPPVVLRGRVRSGAAEVALKIPYWCLRACMNFDGVGCPC